MRRRLRMVALVLLWLCMAAPLAMAAASPDSLSIKMGQMVMVGFRGTSLAESPQIVAAIQKRHIGGVVLFDYDVPFASPTRNITSPSQLARLTQELQEHSAIPLFIAIDQEGGKVNRLKASRGFPVTISAAKLGALNQPDSTRSAARQIAKTLRAMHVNMNFAPVADLNRNPNNPVIGKVERSFSADAARATTHIRLTADTYRAEGIIPTLKHFPGHGSSTTDTHLDFTDVSNSWSKEELEPYRSLIADGYEDAIMTAHVFNATLDPTYPATLSKPTLDGVLRQQLGFKGVIISDDMQMGAIAAHYGLESAIRLALNAGVDILLFGNNTAYDEAIAEKALAIIHALIERGEIQPSRIEESYRRIMALKQRYGVVR
uniref:Glycosyl hydrolase, family 3 n=1 Tax=Chlorobium chlorochromatii (strain CaD3) TaxID=340177 RepID=Q3AP55_CHLCH